jgi:hypothetical protein
MFMEEREADATIAAVLGYPPLEIARAFQDPDFASQPLAASESSGAPWAYLVALYQTNQSLWKAEDAAHAAGIADETLASLKRQIDSLNLRRNELIEAIDQIFRKMLCAGSNSSAPPLHDSPGLILDRLSIESLRAMVLRENAKYAGSANGSRDLLAIEQEMDALVERLREIITAVISGRRTLRQTPRVKIHRAPNDFRVKGNGSASKSSSGKERSADPTLPDTAER